jgi:cell wall-associated NlpC family hydrolase
MLTADITAHHRAIARQRVLTACELMLAHTGAIHYSQGPDRWEGITNKLVAAHGQYPKHADCSSTVTWMLWQALHNTFGVRDVVNGEDWKAGYTGTMAAHGEHVQPIVGHLKIGDALLYGRGPTYEHTTIYTGGGFCFSHGGEAGPFKLAIGYRSDLATARRYI